MKENVSFVVPFRRGAATIVECVKAILEQAGAGEMEVIVVDDGTRDDRLADILRPFIESGDVRLMDGPGRGAAAALNAGIRAAAFPVICQVDQDVIVQPGWMAALTDRLKAPGLAAVQGRYAAHASAGLCARAMNLDLQQRYAAIREDETDHVCTGNVAYRAEALKRVGLFDERLGYGYDNDMSYRLRAAGYQLAMCHDAVSIHCWREGLGGYLVQQYGFGYGRIDVVAKHASRVRGDRVSPAGMMAHPLVLALAMAGFAAAAVSGRQSLALAAAVLVIALAVERAVAGIRAARQFRTAVPLIFPALHLARDLVWVLAIAAWCIRRLARRPGHPSHSMPARPPLSLSTGGFRSSSGLSSLARVVCLIPAHNEASSLPAVVDELRACHPELDILIVDDGSTDETSYVVQTLGVRWLHFPQRLGVGSAIRAGLRLATRLGYDAAVRLDGDGQHRASDVAALLAPLRAGTADVVVGTRFPAGGHGRARVQHRLLAATLSAVTRRPVTDPTSGFCAVGRRAMDLLGEHHPGGYGEPELRLFLSRNGLAVVEIPVSARPRLQGRTSLTPARLAAAAARVALAMIIVPLRQRVGGTLRG
jgi:glycosyltransferase involved in cell wall biosynthesis